MTLEPGVQPGHRDGSREGADPSGWQRGLRVPPGLRSGGYPRG